MSSSAVNPPTIFDSKYTFKSVQGPRTPGGTVSVSVLALPDNPLWNFKLVDTLQEEKKITTDLTWKDVVKIPSDLDWIIHRETYDQHMVFSSIPRLAIDPKINVSGLDRAACVAWSLQYKYFSFSKRIFNLELDDALSNLDGSPISTYRVSYTGLDESEVNERI